MVEEAPQPEERGDEIMESKTLEQLNQLLEPINSTAFADCKYKLRFAHKSEFKYLDKNARYMDQGTFFNLISNIEHDNQLASTPLVYPDETGKLIVQSGNHRLQAAAEAGLEIFLVYYIDKKCTKEELISIQLSHNSLEGKDDPIILKELWDEINTIECKYYSGLNDLKMEELPKVELPPLGRVTLDYLTLAFIFLPDDAERCRKAFETAKDVISCHEMYLARYADFQRMIDALSKVEAAKNIKSPGVAITYVLDVFERHQDDLADGWIDEGPKSKRRVPIGSVLGSDMIPVSLAHDLKRAIQKAKDKKELDGDDPQQLLIKMVQDYLKGV